MKTNIANTGNILPVSTRALIFHMSIPYYKTFITDSVTLSLDFDLLDLNMDIGHYF